MKMMMDEKKVSKFAVENNTKKKCIYKICFKVEVCLLNNKSMKSKYTVEPISDTTIKVTRKRQIIFWSTKRAENFLRFRNQKNN